MNKFERHNEDQTLKHEVSLQCFLRKLKQNNLLNENEYNRSYPFGSALAHIYETPNMHRFFSSTSFHKLLQINSTIDTFSYTLVHYLCDLLLPLNTS